jgi:hypothetical protein
VFRLSYRHRGSLAEPRSCRSERHPHGRARRLRWVDRCADGRKIVLYKQKGDEQSPSDDTKIGMDTAEKSGDRYVWSTGNTGIYGKIYARAGRTEGCKADTSPTIKTTRPD